MDTAILWAFGVLFALSGLLLVVLPFRDAEIVDLAVEWIKARTGDATATWVGSAFLGALLIWLIGPSLLGPVANVPKEVAYSLSIALLALGAAVIFWAVDHDGFDGPYDGDAVFIGGVVYCIVALFSALITWGVDEAVQHWLGG